MLIDGSKASILILFQESEREKLKIQLDDVMKQI